MLPINWSLYSPEFKKSEFDCKCGCGLNLTQPSFLDRLYKARKLANVAFSLSSATRCPKHNKNEGGEDDSSHLTGWAVDIACSDSRKRFLIVSALISVGFTRIGISAKFIHVDSDSSKDPQVIWLY